MKKEYFIIFLLISFVCKSQDRVNDALPQISKINGIITTSTGWLKNASGQWISGKNKIPEDLGADQKTLGNYEQHANGEDNFISIEQRDITIKDKTYILLLKKYKDGFFTYETIQEGWNPYNSYKYYVIDKEEFARIENVEHNSQQDLYINFICSGDVKYIDLKTLTINKIAKEINKQMNDNPNNSLSYELGVKINCFDNKKLVQFYFYDYRYGQNDNMYYETDYATFNNFININ